MGQPIMWAPKCYHAHHAEIGQVRWLEAYSVESKKNMPRYDNGR